MPAALPSSSVSPAEQPALIAHFTAIDTPLDDFALAPPRRLRRLRPLHLTAVAKSLLTTVCGAAMLITAAMVLDPATLQAGSSGMASASASESQQATAQSIAAVIAHSEKLLMLRPADQSRGTEIILWLHDFENPGVMSADELGVIRHNPLFQTVTIYTVSRSEAAGVAGGSSMSAARRGESARNHEPIDVAAAGFIDRWRAQTGVQARVLATGISDMRLDGVASGQQPRAESQKSAATRGPGLSNPRLHLQWAGDSADDLRHASAAIEAPQTQEYHP